MKKLFLSVMLVIAGFCLFAQKLDKAKDLLTKNKLAEAKTEIDNVLANEKNQKNSEAWYTKVKIYNAIAADPVLKTTVPDARDISFSAVKQYVELESKEKDSAKRYLLMYVIDRNQPLIDIYSGYSKDGASFYNANNFNDALVNFKKTLEVFNFLQSKGWTNKMLFDTTTTLYAGISAEKANKLDDAAALYGLIAEKKIKSEGFIEIYKWLANHYKEKNDMATASKFIALGKEVYPTDPFWSGFDIEMTREKGTKEQLFAKYEEIIKENPTNHLFLFNYGVELYQLGYNQEKAQRPPNSKELITRAQDVLTKCIQIKPDYANAQMVLGQILFNQGVDINNEVKAIKPPPGGKLKPDELKKKDDMRKEVTKKFDEAIPYFEKVDQLLGSQGKLKMEEKGILKDAYDLLITIYENKDDKDKAKAYTDKFNDVDRKH